MFCISLVFKASISMQMKLFNSLSPNDAIVCHTYFRQHKFMKKC